MMKVLVLGATGTAGSATVSAALARGWVVRAASRSGGAVALADGWSVDAMTGRGLVPALAGVDVVVDTTNFPRTHGGAAARAFSDAATNVQRAAAAAGVSRLVVLSIVGIDDVPYAYYEAKLAQERAYAAGPVPAVVCRTTQFHEFAEQMLALGRRGRIAVIPRMRSRPVAVVDVAGHLCDAVADPALAGGGRARDLAGPDVITVPQMARRLLAWREEHVRVVPVPVPGRAGRLMAGDGLLPDDARIGPTSFDAWLTDRRRSSDGPRRR
jgi:uncharacterized protein YbjT (DUF2867 family)